MTQLHSGGWLFYLAAAVVYFIWLVAAKPWLGRAATVILAIGFAGHTACFVWQAIGSGIPFTSKALVLSLFAWGLVALYFVTLLRTKMTILGFAVAPVAAVLSMLSEAAPGAPEPTDVHPILWLDVHIIALSLGYAAFALAASVAAVYLIQERFLRKKNLSALFRRLPSLDALDRINQLSIYIGFALLSVGLFSGAAWAIVTASHRVWTDPQSLVAAAMWAWYAVAVPTRLFGGWRGRKSAIFAVVGFGALLIAFVGVMLTTSSFHLGA